MSNQERSMGERFEEFEDDYLKFAMVQHKRCQRPDLHAFMLLNELQPESPNGRDLISSSEHDEYWLGIDVDMLAEVITDKQIQELVRCGVRFDKEYDSLCLFA